jgi:hypothetical protein
LRVRPPICRQYAIDDTSVPEGARFVDWSLGGVTLGLMEDAALESLAGVGAQLAGAPPLERMAAVAAEAVVRTLGASAVVIAVRDELGLRAVHASGLPDDVRRRLPAILASAWTGLERPDRRFVALPIRAYGRRLGVVLVARARLAPDEQAYLRVVTALLGLALQHPAGPQLRVGDLEIDLGEQRVVAGGRDARLTPSETRLLLFLAEEPDRPRTRREILRHLWRTEHVVDERACDAHVSNLRRKIERDPSHPQRLVTVRSVGYALRSM